MKKYELNVRMMFTENKSITFRCYQDGTDMGNACKRFLCQHDMRNSEIVSIREI